MTFVKKIMVNIAAAAVFSSCGLEMESSPWEQDVPFENLTARHLSLLAGKGMETASDFKVALIGDPQVVQGGFREAMAIINRMDDVDFVAVLGDLTDMGLRREWMWIGDAIEKSRHPVLTVVGNHDGLSKGPKIYKKMFGQFDYSLVHKGVKFVFWNNNYPEFEGVDPRWLDGEVASHDRVVVFAHQPPGQALTPPQMASAWESTRSRKSYLASVHGHLHKFGFYVESETDTLIYTVARVENALFGLMTVTKDEIKFSNCIKECKEVIK